MHALSVHGLGKGGQPTTGIVESQHIQSIGLLLSWKI